MHRALITGITGQDGSYLAEALLADQWEVHALARPHRPPNLGCLPPAAAPHIHFHSVSLLDPQTLRQLLHQLQPRHLYHLAAESKADPKAASTPAATLEINTLGTAHLLEAVRVASPATRFFHASTSQIFGAPKIAPQDESTPTQPLNPYGISKAAATDLVRYYRNACQLFAVNGILFNHESPRRSPEFVTAKICRAAARIHLGLQSELILGNLDAHRDWGDARLFIHGFRRALEHPSSNDYIFATGISHSVRDVVQIAFETLHLDWTRWVRSDPALVRTAEASRLVGNPSRAQQDLGWSHPDNFHALIAEMTQTALHRESCTAP